MITEAELFAIRCGINQAVNLLEISKIIIIMDSIHVARFIFDFSIYFFQVHSTAIFKELRKFFLTNNNNSIEFWKCSSCCNWPFFKVVNRDTKQFSKLCFFPTNHCKTLARKECVTTLFETGK